MRERVPSCRERIFWLAESLAGSRTVVAGAGMARHLIDETALYHIEQRCIVAAN